MRILLRVLITTLLTGLAGAALVRLAPGFGVDEREMDARFDAASVQAMRNASRSPLLPALLLGGLGTSEAFNLPVRQLLADRWRLTAVQVSAGLALAWIGALVWGGLGILHRGADWSGSVASFALLALPSGLLAVAVFLAGAPVAAGIALAVFPQIFRYVRQLGMDAFSHPCVAAAAARGVSRSAALLRHAGALAWPRLLPVIGTSASTAIGVAVPMETLCDAPGLGQLVFKAALARDLALLLPLILLTTLAIQSANGFAEWMNRRTA